MRRLAGQREAAAPPVRAVERRRPVRIGVIGKDAEAAQQTGQERELLLPVQLDAVQLALARIDRAAEDRGQAQVHALPVERIAIVGQVLVEAVDRDHAQRPDIIFQARIDVVRQRRIEARIAGFHPDRIALGRLEHARRELREVGAVDRAGERRPQDQVRRERLAQCQVGEEVDVTRLAARGDDRTGPRYRWRARLEVGRLDAQARDQCRAAIDVLRHAEQAEDAFLRGVIGGQRLRQAAFRRRLGRVEIGVGEAGVEALAKVIVEVARILIGQQAGERLAGRGAAAAVAEALLVGADVALAIFAARRQRDVLGDRQIGADGDRQLIVLRRVRPEGVLAEGEGASLEILLAGEQRIARQVRVGEIVRERGAQRRAEQQFVAARIGLRGLAIRHVGANRAVTQPLFQAAGDGPDLVHLLPVTHLLFDTRVGVGRRAIGRPRLQRALAPQDTQPVAEFVVLEARIGAAHPGVRRVGRAPFERTGAGDALTLGVVILEQSLGDAQAGGRLAPRILDIVRAAMGRGIAARQQHAELAILAERIADRGRSAIIVALAELVVAHAAHAGQREALAIERRARRDVDRTGDRIRILIGEERLGHFQIGDDVRRDRVEVDGARRRVDRGDLDAVDRDCRPFRRCAADVDVAALALVTLDADARCTLQRLGDIGIGEAADRVRRDDGDRIVGGALLVERPRGIVDQRRANDDDVALPAARRRQSERHGTAALGRGDRARHRRTAQIVDQQGDVTARIRRRDGELTLQIGRRLRARALDDDARAGQREAAGVIDAARHDWSLDRRPRRGGGRCIDRSGERRLRGETECDKRNPRKRAEGRTDGVHDAPPERDGADACPAPVVSPQPVAGECYMRMQTALRYRDTRPHRVRYIARRRRIVAASRPS